jgi:hypothetical protein
LSWEPESALRSGTCSSVIDLFEAIAAAKELLPVRPSIDPKDMSRRYTICLFCLFIVVYIHLYLRAFVYQENDGIVK